MVFCVGGCCLSLLRVVCCVVSVCGSCCVLCCVVVMCLVVMRCGVLFVVVVFVVWVLFVLAYIVICCVFACVCLVCCGAVLVFDFGFVLFGCVFVLLCVVRDVWFCGCDCDWACGRGCGCGLFVIAFCDVICYRFVVCVCVDVRCGLLLVVAFGVRFVCCGLRRGWLRFVVCRVLMFLLCV